MLKISNKKFRMAAVILISSIICLATNYGHSHIIVTNYDKNIHNIVNLYGKNEDLNLHSYLQRCGYMLRTSNIPSNDGSQFEPYNPKEFDLKTVGDISYKFLKEYQIVNTFESDIFNYEFIRKFKLELNVVLLC